MANKFINELNEIESVAFADELPIWDSSESDTRKTTVNKLSSAITVNLVGEGISAPPSSNAVANAIKNANAVLHVETLPTSPDIKNVIYHNTTDGKYYVGNKINQTTSELNTDSVRYVQTLPVSPNIENLIYAVTAPSGKYKFYAGDKENQTTQELGGSGAIFTGTQAEWDSLTTAEKNEYSQANITDTSSTVFIPVDTVADGNMNPVTSNAVYDVLTTKLLTSGAPVITVNTTYVDSINQQWSQINNNTYHISGNIVLKAGIVPGTQVLTLPFKCLMDTNLMLVGLSQDGQAQWLACAKNSSAVTNASYTSSNMLSGNWAFDWIISKVI